MTRFPFSVAQVTAVCFAFLSLTPVPAAGQEAASSPADANRDEMSAVSSEDGSVVKESAPSVLESPWKLHPALETGLLAAGLTGLSLEAVFKKSNRGPSCGLACDSSTINAFDRSVVGWWNPDAALASDVFLVTTIALPFAAQLIDTAVSGAGDGWSGFGIDALVLVETLAVTAGLTSFLKYAINRTRPYSYNDSLPDDVRLQRDAGLSFPSGHTSMAFAMATSWSVLYMKRHPKSPGVVPVWIGSYLLATTTALLRPVAGRHFWTDIIAGAATGVAVGLLVPYLHELIAGRSSKKHSLIVSPSVVEGGGGAVLTVVTR